MAIKEEILQCVTNLDAMKEKCISPMSDYIKERNSRKQWGIVR